MERKEKVLCVDDEPINLMILKKILGKKYEVITAELGAKALAILDNDPDISLIISDMRMPEMNGLEFVREANKRYANKVYFMLSGYAITDEIQDALNASLISEYFQKPPDFDKIFTALDRNS